MTETVFADFADGKHTEHLRAWVLRSRNWLRITPKPHGETSQGFRKMVNIPVQ